MHLASHKSHHHCRLESHGFSVTPKLSVPALIAGAARFRSPKPPSHSGSTLCDLILGTLDLSLCCALYQWRLAAPCCPIGSSAPRHQQQRACSRACVHSSRAGDGVASVCGQPWQELRTVASQTPTRCNSCIPAAPRHCMASLAAIIRTCAMLQRVMVGPSKILQ